MDRRSRSMESPRRHRNGMMNNGPGGGTAGGDSRRDYRRYSRSRSRSRNRSREREYRRRSRSRERAMHYRHGESDERDLYRDIINDDYQEEMHFYHGGNRGGPGGSARKHEEDFNEDRERFWNERGRDSRARDYERDHREREYERDIRDRRDYRNHHRHGKSYHDREQDDHSDESDISSHYSNNQPNSTLIAFGLQPHITEADLTSALIQYGLAATSIRLIRNSATGASRGFAFVEFNTIEEAERWMDLTQRVLVLPDQSRVNLRYSKDSSKSKPFAQTDWHCGKCGIFNFKRRGTCFKCFASREESEKGGEGCDEISNILTKKIMLRNLDVLTNEEGVLTAMQQHVPDLAKRISKILVSRDPLTQTSRGVCYLNFDTLVDSMNIHNALSGIEPPLQIDNREVIVTYCIDHENREIVPKSSTKSSIEVAAAPSVAVGPLTAAEMAAVTGATAASVGVATKYALEDVPRLAEYSAAMYATTPEEQAYFLKYYTEYYIGEITKGQFNNLPSKSQLIETSTCSGAAVAHSAIQRKQKKTSGIETTATQAAAVKAALTAVTPRGSDGRTYQVMLRNLDVLTNEEAVLTAMQQHVPDLAKRISKILISRDPLTQTSRGVCYLNFDSMVDSMNVHNALSGIEPPLKIDDREVIVGYCIDYEIREIVPKSSKKSSIETSAAPAQYTLEDVPRLAEYSASMYATTPEEQAYFLKYYTEYYIGEITKGQFNNLPSKSQLVETSANSGAAVALSAIQRKQKKMSGIETTATHAAAAAAAAAAAVKAALTAVVTPRGNDGRTYPPPDVSLYQYDETSGYYYDPATGLYYDAHSQYYYNNETGAYLYWDQRKSTYVLATPAAVAATVQDVVKAEAGEDSNKAASADEDSKKEGGRKEGKHDKVKVAKKIVKDMEKWAKQLNQKKDYTAVATPQPLLPSSDVVFPNKASASAPSSSGYADVCFSILEKKERPKLTDFLTTAPTPSSKLVSAYGSDSDEEHTAGLSNPAAVSTPLQSQGQGDASENDYVDFQKLTCLLCKRAFQSLEILTKHLKMSALHKENLQKYNLGRASAPSNTDSDGPGSSALSYRDRAKERRLKYGECDPPPPNRSRERFEKEIKNLASSGRKNEVSAMPIGSNNVGNRLLQKMGWSEGQGLGRKNQGRTNIIEADARSTTAGLGNRLIGWNAGDDYKTYIKRMMKQRYESA